MTPAASPRTPARRGRPRLVAPVSGYSAWEIARILNEALPAVIQKRQQQGFDPSLIAGLRAQWEGIRDAGEEWREWRTSADQSFQTEPTEIAPRSSEEITPDEVAPLLRVTPERVRQLLRAGSLAGRKAGWQWFVSRAEVEAYRVGRRAGPD